MLEDERRIEMGASQEWVATSGEPPGRPWITLRSRTPASITPWTRSCCVGRSTISSMPRPTTSRSNRRVGGLLAYEPSRQHGEPSDVHADGAIAPALAAPNKNRAGFFVEIAPSERERLGNAKAAR